MKTLNLVYPDKSEIKYRIDKFPDGQQQVVIETDLQGDAVKEFWAVPGNHDAFKANTRHKYTILGPTNIVQIKAHLNDFRDLELIICATKSLRNLGVKEIHLYTPYFMGARSDRQFESGSNNYLKDVICPIINSLEFESVTVLDPHSDVLEACLNNFRKEDNSRVVRFAFDNLYGNYILVSPDAGASKKIFKIAEQIGYKGDIITCSKDRDVDGKLTKCIVPIKDTGPLFMKDYIIIDDICDGGATFINIAKELKKLYNCNKIYLIVTHGIFSKGFSELSKYFDGIYCTNSYKDLAGYEFTPDKAIQIENLVKQLNVF